MALMVDADVVDTSDRSLALTIAVEHSFVTYGAIDLKTAATLAAVSDDVARQLGIDALAVRMTEETRSLIEGIGYFDLVPWLLANDEGAAVLCREGAAGFAADRSVLVSILSMFMRYTDEHLCMAKRLLSSISKPIAIYAACLVMSRTLCGPAEKPPPFDYDAIYKASQAALMCGPMAPLDEERTSQTSQTVKTAWVMAASVAMVISCMAQSSILFRTEAPCP